MTWQQLISERRVAREPTDRAESDALRALVRRCVADASIEALSGDGRFDRAYAAARTLATMAIRASGYRVKQPAAHYNTFLALEVADSSTFAGYAAYFDNCRGLRNQLSYEAIDVVSETDLAELVEKVPEFEREVEAWLNTHHPEVC